MGLCPKSFGPYFWGAFHLACLAAIDVESIKTFINTYPMILPCLGCRWHFAQILAENPIPERNLFEWSVDIHNLVNERIGKPTFSYEDAYAHWMSGCDPTKPEPFFDWFTVTLIVFLAAFIISLVFKNFRK